MSDVCKNDPGIVDLTDKRNRCSDFDEDCAVIAEEGGCVRCWAYMPEMGVCPYLVKEERT